MKLYVSPQLHFSDIEVDKASYQLVLLEMTIRKVPQASATV